MQSRRDQVHSYQFFLHRVISGLVARESDPAELPFRRLGGAAMGSMMVAALALAAVGVIGLVVGGGAKSWRDGMSVIVEKESGTRYVFRGGVLYPVLNFASARLILGYNAPTRLVGAKSLIGVPRGPSLGIPSAPDSLPDRRRLLSGGWSFCSELIADGRGGRRAATALGAGRVSSGGTELGIEDGLVVRDASVRSGGLYLVWNSHRHPIDDSGPALRALGVTAGEALPVAPAWLDTLPVGVAIAAPRAETGGRPTTAFGPGRSPQSVLTGQVIEAPAGTFYLVRADELQPVTALQKDIVLAAPATVAAYPGRDPQVVPVSTAVLANAFVDGPPPRTPAGAPDRRPVLASPSPDDFRDGAVCAEFTAGGFAAVVRVGGRLPAGGTATPGSSADGALLADRVLVPPGFGVLVLARSSPDAPGGSLHLVTDQGVRFGLAGPEVAQMLGYPAGRAVGLPAGLVDRLPAGPALDPAAAKEPA